MLQYQQHEMLGRLRHQDLLREAEDERRRRAVASGLPTHGAGHRIGGTLASLGRRIERFGNHLAGSDSAAHSLGGLR